MIEKQCTKFKIVKSFYEFCRDCTHKNRLKSHCKSCDDKRKKKMEEK